MKIASSFTTSTTPLLDEDQTKAFMNDIIVACQTVDMIPVMEVIHKYNLQHKKEIDEFIDGAHRILDYWKQDNDQIHITEVTLHESKCIACSFGKTVKVFHVLFNQLIKGTAGPRIIYSKEFAINLDIQEGLLIDFGWCNAFLNKKELSNIL